jgi:hypothetical protein
MPSTFGSINEVRGAGVPQFQQVPTVVGDTGEGVMQAAQLGQSLFRQAQEFGQQQEQAESQSALGGLQTKLANIRQAGATDKSVNIVSQQRRAYSQFLAQHPEAAGEATKAFKASTGMTPGGLSTEEQAEMKDTNEAISLGFGYHGASNEYNEKMKNHYIQLKQEDKLTSFKISKISAQVQERSLHKSVLKDTVLGGAKTMFSTFTEKTDDEMGDLMSRWDSGNLSTEEALMTIAQARRKVNTDIASLGEYSTDPVIKNYAQPTLDSLQLAEDYVNSKFEVEAATASMKRNKTIAKARLLADPEVLALSAATEVFPNVTGLDAHISAKTLKVLNQGLMSKDGMLPTKPKPVAFEDLDDGEKDVISKTLHNMFKGGLPGYLQREVGRAEKEASLTLTGIAEYVNRNGQDLSPEDTHFFVKLLNIPGAIESLNPEQRGVVMQGMDAHVLDVVDVSVRESITQAEIPVSFAARTYGFAGATKSQPAAEVADLVVVEGDVHWKVKPQFRGNASAEVGVRKLNQNIAENITPSINAMSKGLGISFDTFAGTLFPVAGQEEGKDGEAKKQETFVEKPTTTPGAGDAGKVEGAVLDTSSPDSFVSSIMPTVTDTVQGTGIYPEVAAAQAILESGWGKHVKGGNFFGIKGSGQTITTHEFIDGEKVKIEDKFKTFEGFEDSVAGYKDFLQSNPRYTGALQAGSAEEQAQALQDAGYATDPDYAKKLISIIKRIRGGK